jgi:hypothetical protein
MGYFVGISTNMGHTMTFKVLTDDTHKVIVRSEVRPADDPSRPNHRLTDLFADGEGLSQVFVRSKFDTSDPEDFTRIDPVTGEVEQVNNPSMVPVDTAELVDTSELIGRTFLMDGQDEGTTHRARITEMITDDEYERTQDPEII